MSQKVDPQQLLAECVAQWSAAGWRIESHSDYVAVLIAPAPTMGQGFAKAGIFGMAWASKKQQRAPRVTLYADENGVRQV